MSVPTLPDRLLIERDELTPFDTLRPTSAHGPIEAVIAAAGRGTRLGADVPKVLVQIDGESILERLLRRLTGLVDRITLVVSPEGRSAIERATLRRPPVPMRLVVQSAPTGMADAVLATAPAFEADARYGAAAPTVVVLWGDQAGLRRRTVRAALAVHCLHPRRPSLTMPVAEVDDAYVHYVLDEASRVTAVYQRREGDEVPARGLADCGCFVAERVPLFEALADLRRSGDTLAGRVTGEQNFLPVVAHLGRRGRVVVVKCADATDVVGINTVADLQRLAGLHR